MEDRRPTSWVQDGVCATCGKTLLPLTYAIAIHDDPRGVDRPLRKCAGCGARYPTADDVSWGLDSFEQQTHERR